MEELCTGCLLTRKELRVLNEEKTRLYLSQLPEDLRLELHSIKFSFCFHCSAVIHRMYRFQQLSTWAMQRLLAYHTTLTLGDLSDRPSFSQLNVTRETQINIPSESYIADVKTEQDIFEQTDNIKTENKNDITENEIDLIENDTVQNDNVENEDDIIGIDYQMDDCNDMDYNWENDSYINDILVSKLNSCYKNDTDDSEKAIAPKQKSKKKEKSIASKKNKDVKVRNKSLKSIVKTEEKTSKNLMKKLKTHKRTRKKSAKTLPDKIQNETDEDNESITVENDNITAEKDNITMANDNTTMTNDNIIMENDNTKIENDISKDNDNITIAKSNKIKAEKVMITLNKSQIREERKQMTYVSDYALSHFKCKNCIMGFDNISDYDKHFAEFHHENLGPHVCETCSRRFAERVNLVEHSREHTVRFKCSLCTMVWSNVAAIEAHLTEHARFECEQCGIVTGSMLHHQVHLNKVHGLKLQCTLCDKMFSSGKTLRYHLKVLHKGQNRYPCPHCGKVYQWKSNLFRHIKNHKAQTTGELFCALCDKYFSSVATYKQHLAINKRHATPQQYSFSCDQCDKRFMLKRDLTDHVNWEHLHKTVHVCAQCSKPFKSYMALYLHQNVHKDPADRGNLCHLCGKCYPTQSKLKSHLLAKHSDEMPYKCTLCDATFNWYSSLYRHAQKVHGLTKEQYKIKKPKRADQLPSVE